MTSDLLQSYLGNRLQGKSLFTPLKLLKEKRILQSMILQSPDDCVINQLVCQGQEAYTQTSVSGSWIA